MERGKWNLLAGTETSNLCSKARCHSWKWRFVRSLQLMMRDSNLNQWKTCNLNLWNDSVVAVGKFLSEE